MPAASATSSHTSRERMARCQHSPGCCPVTVMKPKFRIEAPLACASRSMTTTLLPSRAAASACARPQMPAPTTATSNEPSVVDLKFMLFFGIRVQNFKSKTTWISNGLPVWL